MKKGLTWMLCMMMAILPCAAFAQTAEAIVIAPVTVKVTAPYSGTLLPFDLQGGDAVRSGDVLFSMDEIPVYAREDGKVTAVFAQAGDDAEGIISRYGGLAVLEPVHPTYVAASTRDAYNDAKNKWLNAGEMLYLKKGNDKGTGRVTQVNGEEYAVEILTGSFEVDDTVQCYRESGYANDSLTGKGKVKRYPDVRVTSAGRVASVRVTAGDSVKAGDVLFTMRDPTAPKDAGSDIVSPAAGAVSLLGVHSGDRVIRGQLLCEIADLTRLELSCDLDEMDLSSVREGDSLSYTLDAYGDRVFTGTVLALRPIGTKKTNASYFDLRISLPDDVRILPGMNGTVRIGE